jgi:hypothetical protein
MDQCDVHVISNPNAYEGFMASTEFGYALASVLNSSGSCKKICFTNTPLGYNIFKHCPTLSCEDFKKNLYSNPLYTNELNYYRKIREKNDASFNIPSEEDYFLDIKYRQGSLLLLEERDALIIGLDKLLCPEIPTQEH